jgi:uncharacterized protein
MATCRRRRHAVNRSTQLRRFCRILHRDLGYLFFGATIVYAVSGIAINHRDDWNPSYSIRKSELPLPAEARQESLARADAAALLKNAGITRHYQNHYSPGEGLTKIFFTNGNALLDHRKGVMTVETLSRRPLLHTFNALHYNPGRWWTWYADLFCAALLIIAITGLFLLRGKHGITRRGGALVLLGILGPALLVVLYL